MVIRCAAYVALALAGGCGRIGFDDHGTAAGDAAGDAPPCAAGPWGPLVPQSGLATIENLSDDRMTLMFSSERNGGTSQNDLFLTTRSCL